MRLRAAVPLAGTLGTPLRQVGCARRVFIRVLILALFAFSSALAGCGGSGGSGSTTPARSVTPSLTVRWAARSRDVQGPASALSAVVTVTGQNGTRVVFGANRPDGTAAANQTVGASAPVTAGSTVGLKIEFFAGANGGGLRVASANATVAIGSDGIIAVPVTNVVTDIASVEVTAGQSLSAGEQKFLGYSVRGKDGQIMVLSPGAAFFSVASGAEALSVEGEVGKGLSGGSPTVIATVDGVASARVMVAVLPAVKIALVADGNNAQAIALLQLLQARGITPTRFDAVPDLSTLQGFDTLMVWSPPTVTANDAPTVEAFLNAGRGVVLLEDAPARLAGANFDRGADVRPISSWFAGVTRLAPGEPKTTYAREGAGLFPLPPGLTPGGVAHKDDGYAHAHIVIPDSSVLNQTVDRVLEGTSGAVDISALAYNHPSGGRVYWQFHPYSLNAEYTDRVLSLLIAGTNWTAKH